MNRSDTSRSSINGTVVVTALVQARRRATQSRNTILSSCDLNMAYPIPRLASAIAVASSHELSCGHCPEVNKVVKQLDEVVGRIEPKSPLRCLRKPGLGIEDGRGEVPGLEEDGDQVTAVTKERVRRRDNQAEPQSESHKQEDGRGQKKHRQRGRAPSGKSSTNKTAHRQQQCHQVDQNSSQRENQLGNENLPDQTFVRNDAHGTLIHAVAKKPHGTIPANKKTG